MSGRHPADDRPVGLEFRRVGWVASAVVAIEVLALGGAVWLSSIDADQSWLVTAVIVLPVAPLIFGSAALVMSAYRTGEFSAAIGLLLGSLLAYVGLGAILVGLVVALSESS